MLKRFVLLIMGITYTASTLSMESMTVTTYIEKIEAEVRPLILSMPMESITLTHYVKNLETIASFNMLLKTNRLGPISSALSSIASGIANTTSNIANYVTSIAYPEAAFNACFGTFFAVSTILIAGTPLYIAYQAFTNKNKPTTKPAAPTTNQDRISIDISLDLENCR